MRIDVLVMMTSRFWGNDKFKFYKLIVNFVYEFYVFRIVFYLLCLKRWGLDWLVRSHRRVNVGATHDTIWVVTTMK